MTKKNKTPIFADKLPKKLVRLLREVQTFIVEHPKQFDMGSWGRPERNACGTIGCIGHHMAMRDLPKNVVRAAVEKDRMEPVYSWDSHIQRLVSDWRRRNIPPQFSDNFNTLFFPADPQWDGFITPGGNITPKLAAKRIEHFLQTGE